MQKTDDLKTMTVARVKNVEDELAACLVTDPKKTLEACKAERLEPRHFFNSSHRAIYEAACNIGEKAADVHCLRAELVRLGTSSLVSEALAHAIANSIPTCNNAVDYARIIREAYFRRQLGSCGALMKEMADLEKPISEITNEARGMIVGVEKGMGWAHLSHFSDGVSDLLDGILQGKGDGLLSCETGFRDLDNLIGGLKQGQFCLAAGRPSMGKTVFAVQVAAHAALKQGRRALLFSLEMPARQLQLRLISAMTSTPSKCLIHNLNVDWSKVHDAHARLEKAKFGIYDHGSLGISELRAITSSFASQHGGVDIIVIDYIGLMDPGGKYETRNIEVSKLSAGIKSLTRDHNCAVLCLSQLSRDVERREDKRPLLSDLRDSGSLEQDADVVMMLYRDDYYNSDTKNHGLSEVHVAKNRNGECGTIYLEHEFHYQRFKNTERTPEQ